MLRITSHLFTGKNCVQIGPHLEEQSMKLLQLLSSQNLLWSYYVTLWGLSFGRKLRAWMKRASGAGLKNFKKMDHYKVFSLLFLLFFHAALKFVMYVWSYTEIHYLPKLYEKLSSFRWAVHEKPLVTGPNWLLSCLHVS